VGNVILGHIYQLTSSQDAIITLTTACSIAGFAVTIIQCKYGAGRHRGDVSPEDYEYGMLVNFVNQPVYLFAICFVKLAVGAALMRIATKKLYKRLILGVMGFMLIYTVVCFFVGRIASLHVYMYVTR